MEPQPTQYDRLMVELARLRKQIPAILSEAREARAKSAEIRAISAVLREPAGPESDYSASSS